MTPLNSTASSPGTSIIADIDMAADNMAADDIGRRQHRLAEAICANFFQQLKLLNRMMVELPLGWVLADSAPARPATGAAIAAHPIAQKAIKAVFEKESLEKESLEKERLEQEVLKKDILKKAVLEKAVPEKARLQEAIAEAAVADTAARDSEILPATRKAKKAKTAEVVTSGNKQGKPSRKKPEPRI